jgi:phosphonate transport system permease protein
VSPEERWSKVRRLRRARPRSRLVRASACIALAAVLWAWLGGWIDWSGILAPARRANLARFLARDAMPRPLRDDGFSWSGLARWVGGVLREHGLTALAATFWISVLAIALATAAAWLLAPLGARTLWRRDPYLARDSARRGRGGAGAPGLVAAAARGLCVLLRAIPEYVWAFLLLAVLGPTPWPLVLALAIHNAGILGRLSAESLENVDAAPARALAMLGARREQIAWTALRPGAFGRLVLFVLYRYETCVREATVLGMLGVVSLGYWISDARVRQRYDEMLLLIALGGGLVLAGDLASYAVRRWLRRGV